ncbi:MAG: ABC transporter substrate-binding protein [Deltaproteobacteria bacterium]|nr:ABC transporter substrate-binding protein [Deltaproteobacteria bacterium]
MNMRRIGVPWVLAAFLFAFTGISETACAESVLDRIEKTGKVNIGYREGAVPFGYMNDKGEWVGFDMDLGTELVKALEAKFNKKIEHTKTPMNPKNRIPLVANGTIDAGIGATTITLEREGAIDFSLPYFLTGTRLLVLKGSPIRDYRDLAGKKVGVGSGSTANIKGLQKAVDSKMINPPCEMVLFEDHTKGFLGLQQGKVDAYFTDEAMLAGMKAKAQKPDDFEIVGAFLTYEPYGIILPPDDSKWRDFVNATLIRMFKDGTFEKTYAKWFGPQGQLLLPMPEEYRVMLKVLSFPD